MHEDKGACNSSEMHKNCFNVIANDINDCVGRTEQSEQTGREQANNALAGAWSRDAERRRRLADDQNAVGECRST